VPVPLERRTSFQNNHTHQEVDDMNTKQIIQSTVVGFAGVITSMAMSTPAWAMVSTSPDPGPGFPAGQVARAPATPAVAEDGTRWDIAAVATGAVGGIAMAGAGFATSRRVRRGYSRVGASSQHGSRSVGEHA
jgi:hypothetical protein